MNILQFESLNLEFIWKRYEINKFWSLKYKTRSNSVIIQKGRGLFIKTQGPAREFSGWWVNFNKAKGFFNKFTCEGVSGLLSR
jgi:hypothetical protein